MNLLVSFCRYSEKHNRHGGHSSSGVRNSRNTLHHETNQQKKGKVRLISISLQMTRLACVHHAICLSLSSWGSYVGALETYPGVTVSFNSKIHSKRQEVSERYVTS